MNNVTLANDNAVNAVDVIKMNKKKIYSYLCRRCRGIWYMGGGKLT